MVALEAKMATLGTALSEANARAEAEGQARQRAEEKTEALRERLEATEAMLVSHTHPSLCSHHEQTADSHGLRCVSNPERESWVRCRARRSTASSSTKSRTS